MQGEYARKFVHITVGTAVAFLPLFLSWHLVQLVGIVSIVFIVTARYTGLIKSWYDIERSSWGDITGPASLIALSLFEPSRLLFAAACLHIALADGFAAIVGKNLGKTNQYKVFGYTKSIAGTLTFFLISMVIMAGVVAFGGANASVSILAFVSIPLITAAIENIAVAGVDNMLITGTIVLLFSVFKVT